MQIDLDLWEREATEAIEKMGGIIYEFYGRDLLALIVEIRRLREIIKAKDEKNTLTNWLDDAITKSLAKCDFSTKDSDKFKIAKSPEESK
jgi:hypothetical protein